MMNFKKIMSLFLAALMLCGAMAGLSVITVSADETEGEETDTTEESAVLESVEDLYTEIYASPEAKLAMSALAFPEEMFLLANLSEETLNAFLKAIRDKDLWIPLKAVATPTNAGWRPMALKMELMEEHAAMQAAIAEHKAKQAAEAAVKARETSDEN